MQSNIKFIGSILIVVSVLLLLSYFNTKEIMQVVEIKEIEEKEKTNNFFAILSIPKINLKKELYNNEQNCVNQNIYVHYASTFPSDGTSNVILAAHSGYGTTAYFHDLYLLDINDSIYLYYENKQYEYVITKIEYQDKTGTLYLKENNEDMLTLITCTKNDSSTQTIYYSSLKSVKFV